MLGLAPTGKRVKWTGISIVRIVDGLIAELWGDYDKLDAYQQLGGILTTGESEALNSLSICGTMGAQVKTEDVRALVVVAR